MKNNTLGALDLAKQKLIHGDAQLAESYYIRAASEGTPACIVNMHRITKGYMVLALDAYAPSIYFDSLTQLKGLAKSSELCRTEYSKAIGAFLNFRNLFLREIALYYFQEVSACSWGSGFPKSLHELYEYLKKNRSSIVDGDCFGIKAYYPKCDFRKLERDLMKVEAYCLNLLLMYTAVKSTHYDGKKYYANTYDFGDYAFTEIKSRDSYSSNAVVMPRLHLLGLEAYSDDYRAALQDLTKQIRKKGAFSSPKELKKEVSRLVARKQAKDASEKEFFKYEKAFEKEDLERQSFIKISLKFNPFAFMLKGFGRRFLGMDEVGSFEIDTVFTRKKLLGVCNMIAWANNWSVETVRAFTVLLFFVSLFFYVILAISMKLGFYLFNLHVEKRS